MMTVVEHMKAAGYDPALAKTIIGLGTMECERIQLRTFRCRPWAFGEALSVEATAFVPHTDGYEHPYPRGWPNSQYATITAYFPIEEKEANQPWTESGI